MTQVELAKKAGMTQKTVSRMESADKGVRESTLLKVFNALEVRDNLPELKEIKQSDDQISGSIKI